MAPTPPSWPRRLMNATPVMSDRMWLGFIVLMLLLCGFMFGSFVCAWTAGREVPRLSVQQQLDALDKRLKVLEQRWELPGRN